MVGDGLPVADCGSVEVRFGVGAIEATAIKSCELPIELERSEP
jgi:hypothetical protein